ncbi:hypothetical protein Lser_V15G40437 [Lactuca serriola]
MTMCLDGGLNGACTKARKWILDHDSVTTIPSRGKTWLSILGVCEWEGTNPMPPKFWHLPSLLPMYPAKMWCYGPLGLVKLNCLRSHGKAGLWAIIYKSLQDDDKHDMCWKVNNCYPAWSKAKLAKCFTGLTVGLKNKIRVTFAADPSSLEEPLHRLKMI